MRKKLFILSVILMLAWVVAFIIFDAGIIIRMLLIILALVLLVRLLYDKPLIR